MFCRRLIFAAQLFLPILAVTGCSKAPSRGVERVAILPLENLSGDADSSWIGRAISGIAVARATGNASVATFAAATPRDSGLQHATRTVSGYFSAREGRIILVGTVRDEPERRNLESFRAAGPDVLALAESVAAHTGAPLHPYTTDNLKAVEELFRGIAAREPDVAEQHIERAIALDPQFGSAHLARIELLVRTRRAEEARGVLGTALSVRLTPLEKARLELLAAEVAGDSKARLNAVVRLAELQPGDSDLWMAAANAQMETRDFRAAIRSLEKVLELNPAEENALNARAYACTFAGDADAALRAAQEYRERLPNAANAIDSQGEISFYFGRYTEASKLFLEAHARNPGIVGGIEPLRAAFSLFMAGDLNGADKLAGGYYAALRQRREPTADLRARVWRFLTGRQPGPLPDTPLSRAMQALWALNAGDRTTAAASAAKVRLEARDTAAANAAGLTLLLSQPSATPEVWKERMETAAPAPQAARERERLLGWALLLDKQPAAAAEVWRRVLEQTSPLLAHDARLMLAWALTEAGQTEEARKLVPHGFLPPSNFDPSLTSLAWARARGILQKIH